MPLYRDVELRDFFLSACACPPPVLSHLRPNKKERPTKERSKS